MSKLWKRRISAMAQGVGAMALVSGAIALLVLSCTREPVRVDSPLRAVAVEPLATLAGAPGCILWERLPDGALDMRCEEEKEFQLYIDLQVRGSSGVLESRTNETFVLSEGITPTAPVSATIDTEGLTAIGELWARPRWVRRFSSEFGVVGGMTCGYDEVDADGFVLCRPLYPYYLPAVIAVVE